MSDPDQTRTLARHQGARGEVVLRRRVTERGEVYELIVDGTFAMDSSETSTELALARTAGRRGATLLVGGLGLGFTVDELLRLDVEEVDVVELEECLVAWAGDGLTLALARVASDPRVHLHIGDVAEVLLGSRGSPIPPDKTWDAILLDVDNGPDFLIHEANARVYGSHLLGAAADRLVPGGTLAVWCQGPSPALAKTMGGLGGRVEAQLIEVVRDNRWLAYAIYSLTR